MQFPGQGNIFGPIRLPNVPGGLIYGPTGRFRVEVAFPAFSGMVSRNRRGVSPYCRRVVSLMLMAMYHFVHPSNPLRPFIMVRHILISGTRFSVRLAGSAF